MRVGYTRFPQSALLGGAPPTVSSVAELFAGHQVTQVFFDIVSRSEAPPEFEKAIDGIGPGDTLVIPTISSLGGSVKEVRDNLARITEKSAFLYSVRERFETSSSICFEPEWLINVLADLAGTPPKIVATHPVRSGVGEQKNKGGRRYVLSGDAVAKAIQLLRGGMSTKDVARKCGCSPRTIRRVSQGNYGVAPQNF